MIFPNLIKFYDYLFNNIYVFINTPCSSCIYSMLSNENYAGYENLMSLNYP